MSSVTWGILSAYRHPRLSFERQLSAQFGEARLLFYGMLACFLGLVSRMPSVFRESLTSEEFPLQAVVASQFVVSLLFGPLLMYLVAAVSHVAFKAFGGRGDWREARLALFWSALAMSPLALIAGVMDVMAADWIHGTALVLIVVVFVSYWMQCLVRVEFGSGPSGLTDGSEALTPGAASGRARAREFGHSLAGKPGG